MTDVDNDLLLEHLKRIQAELADGKERDRELLSRVSNLERAMAGFHVDLVENRHAIDKLSERIERRLELSPSRT